MFFTLEDFLATGIPRLVDGKPRFKALIASYNHIGRYQPGPVVTHDPRLGVTLYQGHREWGGRSVAGIIGEMFRQSEKPTVQEVVACIRSEAEESKRLSQLSIGKMLEREHIEDGENAVLIAYAGRHPHFVESVGEVVRFGARNQSVPRIVVTCDCESERKHGPLAALMTSGEITSVVLGGGCGGVASMAAITDALIDRWRVSYPL